MVPTFSHEHREKKSTCRMIHTEHLLNAGRRPYTPQNWVEQKEKRERREKKGNQHGTRIPKREM